MNEEHRTILQKNQVLLVQGGLVLDEVFLACLKSSKILTASMVEELETIQGMMKKVSHFTSLLPRRGPHAFEEFIKTCVLTDQEWIADALDPKLASKYRGQTLPRVSRPNPTTNPVVNPTLEPIPHPNPYPTPNPLPIDTPPDSMTNFIPMNIQNINPAEPNMARLINEVNNVYKMSADPRGKLVILNNTSFSHMSDRGGSTYDAVNLSELFRKLHFDVDIWTDITAKEIMQKIDAERQSPFLKDYDCYAMAILSHGNRGVIYGSDTERVSIEDEIVKSFDSIHCPALSGKPKIFLVQACQGNAVSLGAIPQADDPDEAKPEPVKQLEEKVEEMRLIDDADSVPVLPSTHEKADMIMAYSTVPGYKSWRNPELGSWFMRDLITVVAHNAHQDHFADMLTQVSSRMSERSVAYKGFVQINETRTTLRKKLYFLPGYVQKC